MQGCGRVACLVFLILWELQWCSLLQHRPCTQSARHAWHDQCSSNGSRRARSSAKKRSSNGTAKVPPQASTHPVAGALQPISDSTKTC